MSTAWKILHAKNNSLTIDLWEEEVLLDDLKKATRRIESYGQIKSFIGLTF